MKKSKFFAGITSFLFGEQNILLLRRISSVHPIMLCGFLHALTGSAERTDFLRDVRYPGSVEEKCRRTEEGVSENGSLAAITVNSETDGVLQNKRLFAENSNLAAITVNSETDGALQNKRSFAENGSLAMIVAGLDRARIDQQG